MNRFLLAGLVFAATSFAAGAQSFVNYPAWSSLLPPVRAAYIAGAYDSYVTYQPHGVDLAGHFADCLRRLGMSNVELSDAIYNFAYFRPDLHAQAVSATMVQYLGQVCGAPAS